MNNWAIFLMDDSFNILWSSLVHPFYWYGSEQPKRKTDAASRDEKYLKWQGIDCVYIYVELEEEEL